MWQTHCRGMGKREVVVPLVVSLSNHKQEVWRSFDMLRTNGEFEVFDGSGERMLDDADLLPTQLPAGQAHEAGEPRVLRHVGGRAGGGVPCVQGVQSGRGGVRGVEREKAAMTRWAPLS